MKWPGLGVSETEGGAGKTECQASVRKPTREARGPQLLTHRLSDPLPCIRSICTPKKPQNTKSSVFYYEVFP